jgi:exodeoxyribonuclease VII small subunit
MSEESYTSAMDELEEIVQKLENGIISIDDLSVNINRASDLIKFCKNKLKTTDMEVEKILTELET